MKSQKGITLISVTIYVIGMTVIIGLLATMTTYFYKNTDDVRNITPIAEYTVFNSFFAEEVNIPDMEILECTENYIIFSNGVQYTYISENQGIYKDKVKICRNIEKCVFEQGISKTGKQTVKVTIKAKNDTNANRQPIVYTLK